MGIKRLTVTVIGFYVDLVAFPTATPYLGFHVGLILMHFCSAEENETETKFLDPDHPENLINCFSSLDGPFQSLHEYSCVA